MVALLLLVVRLGTLLFVAVAVPLPLLVIDDIVTDGVEVFIVGTLVSLNGIS